MFLAGGLETFMREYGIWLDNRRTAFPADFKDGQEGMVDMRELVNRLSGMLVELVASKVSAKRRTAAVRIPHVVRLRKREVQGHSVSVWRCRVAPIHQLQRPGDREMLRFLSR
ncbi:hypothetical protein WEH80_37100 [Actinomycetes bacterium KLBMP 9759]